MRKLVISAVAAALLAGCGSSNQDFISQNNNQGPQPVPPKQVNFQFSLLAQGREPTTQVPSEITDFRFIVRDENLRVVFDDARTKTDRVELSVDGTGTSIELCYLIDGVKAYSNLFPLANFEPLDIVNPRVSPVPFQGAQSLVLVPDDPVVETEATVTFRALLNDSENLEVTASTIFNSLDDRIFGFFDPQTPNVGVGASEGTTQVQATYSDPVTNVIIGTDQGLPEVKLFDGPRAAEGRIASFFAYEPNFAGGVRVAAGDVNGDGEADIVTGSGEGAPVVRIFSGSGDQSLGSFFAFDPGFTGGVFVSAGDINNDGSDDIVVGAGSGGGPQVRVFSGTDGSELSSFFAFDPGFTGGVRVAAGDVNGDGFADIITGAGPGGGPRVRIFSGTDNSSLGDFFAYGQDFQGGVTVASGDVNNDGIDDIITGAGSGGVPHVRIFDGENQNQLADFFAYEPNFLGGVRVGSGDVTGDGVDDVIVSPGPGGAPIVRVFDGQGNQQVEFFAFAEGFTGGVFVGGVSTQEEPENTLQTSTDVTVVSRR